MKIRILTYILLLFSSSIFAMTKPIEVDGIVYQVIDRQAKTCEVTSKYSFYEGNIIIPDSVTLNGQRYAVTSIDNFAFNQCYQVRSITFPTSTLRRIGNYAFSNCTGLTDITIPSSLDSIGEGAFAECSGIWRFIVSQENEHFSTDDNHALFNKDKTILYSYPSDNGESRYIVPSTVKKIGEYAFYNNKTLHSITLPDGLESVGKNTFSLCYNLTNLILPSSLKRIGKECFTFCHNLKSILIPASVEKIGAGVFNDCGSLKSIEVATVNKSYVNIDGGLYTITQDTLIAFPAANDVVTVKLPESVTTISQGAFSSCKSLKSIVLPQKLIRIGNSAFSNCENLTSIIIPSGVKNIQEECFWSCINLKEIKFSEGLTYVGGRAFAYCENLKSIQLPKSLTQVMGFDLSSLTSITLLNPEPPYIDDISEEFDPSQCTLYVPAGSTSKYQADENWTQFILKEITSTRNEIVPSEIQVATSGNTLSISGNIAGKQLAVYNILGKLFYSKTLNSTDISLNIPQSGFYIIRIDNKTFKVKL